MKSAHEEHLQCIQQEILRLQQDYAIALEQGKEFDFLKQIRQRIRSLEQVFNIPS